MNMGSFTKAIPTNVLSEMDVNVYARTTSRRTVLGIYFATLLIAGVFFFTREHLLLCLGIATLFSLVMGFANLRACLLVYLATAVIIHPIVTVELPLLPLLKFSRVFLFGIIICFSLQSGKFKVKMPVAGIILFSFIVSTFITALLSGDVVVNINSTLAYLIEVLCVLIMVYSLLSYEDIFILADLLLISLCVTLFIGFLEIGHGESLFNQFIAIGSKVNVFAYDVEYSRAVFRRLYSSFEHPFGFGNFGAIITPLFLACYRIKENKRYLAGVVLCGIPVLLSFSRAVLVTWCLVIALFFLLSSRRGRTRDVVIFGGIIAMFLIYAVPMLGLDEYFGEYLNPSVLMSGSDRYGSSVYSRVDNITMSLWYLKERPFFGFGDRTIAGYVLSNAVTGIGYLESYFAKTLLSFGTIGLSLLICYYLSLTRRLLQGWRRLSPHEPANYLYIAASSILLAYMLHSLHSAWFNETLFVTFVNLPFLPTYSTSDAK
jgi:hypothetical protein